MNICSPLADKPIRTLADVRRFAGERTIHWLSRSANLLEEIFDEAQTFEQKIALLEATGKLAERFGKFSSLDKPLLRGTQSSVVEFIRRTEGIEAID
jgi:hypothetical protein